MPARTTDNTSTAYGIPPDPRNTHTTNAHVRRQLTTTHMYHGSIFALQLYHHAQLVTYLHLFAQVQDVLLRQYAPSSQHIDLLVQHGEFSAAIHGSSVLWFKQYFDPAQKNAHCAVKFSLCSTEQKQDIGICSSATGNLRSNAPSAVASTNSERLSLSLLCNWLEPPPQPLGQHGVISLEGVACPSGPSRSAQMQPAPSSQMLSNSVQKIIQYVLWLVDSRQNCAANASLRYLLVFAAVDRQN